MHLLIPHVSSKVRFQPLDDAWGCDSWGIGLGARCIVADPCRGRAGLGQRVYQERQSAVAAIIPWGESIGSAFSYLGWTGDGFDPPSRASSLIWASCDARYQCAWHIRLTAYGSSMREHPSCRRCAAARRPGVASTRAASIQPLSGAVCVPLVRVRSFDAV